MKYITLILLISLLFQRPGFGQEVTVGSETVLIDISAWRTTLAKAPTASSRLSYWDGLPISLPLPGKSSGRFFVFENQLMSGDFKKAFPQISTYTLFSDQKNRRIGSLTLSPFGMYVLVSTPDGLLEIRPQDQSKSGTHLVRYQTGSYMKCEAEKLLNNNQAIEYPNRAFSSINGDQRRTYDLAIVTTGEFYQSNSIGIADPAAADVAVNTLITVIVNGISAIYLEELAVNFSLLTPFLYRNPATDAFDPASGNSRTAQANAAVSANFASDDYDIGHVFNDSDFCGSPIRDNIDGSENTFNGSAIDNFGFCAPISASSDLNFRVISFSVSANGVYTFNTTAGTTMDEGIALFQGFNAAAPNSCVNFIGANRSLDATATLTPFRTPITANLNTGVAYQLVLFSATAGSTGTIEIAFAGPGRLTGNCQFAGGGVATIGVVCNGGSKGRGWSSIGNTSDIGSFVRLAAHEFGHQFSARHTFNGSGSACNGGNISSNHSYEIGSGTTIMSYRGICGTGQNVPPSTGTPDPDNYFHTHSLTQMINYIDGSGGCAEVVDFGNIPPQADANPAGGTYVIPGGTPFELQGSATDANGDQLWYCWEQYDEDGGGTPTQGLIGPAAGADDRAPLFRSFPPSTASLRTFPTLDSILDNSNVAVFEALPTVDRDLTFRLTVRDKNSFGGGTDCDAIEVEVDGDTGPFRITDPNEDACLVSGTMQTITWDVAGSDGGDVNCANVDIWLSVDGGQTFAYPLAISTANDGTEEVMLPDMVRTLEGRIRVGCSDNIFFDINDEDIIIECPELLVVTDNPAEGTYRAGGTIRTSGLVEVNNNTQFLAATQVILTDGFLADMNFGQQFLARIQPCDPCALGTSSLIASSAAEDPPVSDAPNFSPLTGINKPDDAGKGTSNLKVYPNPFSEKLVVTFELEADGPVSIWLFDLTGRRRTEAYRSDWLEAGRHEIEINGNQLTPGIYYCQLISRGKQQQTKVVKGGY